MLLPVTVDKQSPFLGDPCALCKQPFAPGDDVVICPADGSVHHAHCWRTNGNHCTAYGCDGHGEIGQVIEHQGSHTPSRRSRPRVEPIQVGPDLGRGRGRSKVRTMPATSGRVGCGCGRGCSFLFVLLLVLFCGMACFGLWALGDWIAVDLFDSAYRSELFGWFNDLFVIQPA